MTVPILAGSYYCTKLFGTAPQYTLDKKKGEKGQKWIKMENSEIDPTY
jgi:hypothetical protein